MRKSKQLTALMILMYTAMEVVTTNHHFLQRYLPGRRWQHKNFHDTEATRYGRGFQPKAGLNAISGMSRSNKIRSEIFTSYNNTNVTAQTDTTVILHCKLTDIINVTKTPVFWIKKSNPPQILTMNNETHIRDHRYYVFYEKESRDWTLHLRYATLDDAGLYDCQVQTNPKSSLFVRLILIEARAKILGLNTKSVKAGSPLRLSCRLFNSTVAPTYIFWYHDDRMINYDLQGGAGVRHGRHGSELIIPRAEQRHAGNYSCVPSNARQDSVTVTVELLNEKSAAMHQGSKNGCRPQQTTDAIYLLTILSLAMVIRR